MTSVFWDFDQDELTKILNPELKEGQCDPDEVPAPPDEATTQPGDLWILGDHRLLCGDSSKPEDVDRLLDGATIHLVNTDPPYNVKVEPRSNNAIAAGLSSFAGPKHHQSLDLARHPEKSKPTGKQAPGQGPAAGQRLRFGRGVRRVARCLVRQHRPRARAAAGHSTSGAATRICGNYPPVLKACELYFSQAIIWVKEHPVLTRKDFMGNHEMVLLWLARRGRSRGLGPNNAVDVWSVKKINPQSMVHLTEKPVELAARAMQYSSRPGENVLDLFGGSGSTLMAAEQTGRRRLPDGTRSAVLRRDRRAVGEVHRTKGRTDLGGGGVNATFGPCRGRWPALGHRRHQQENAPTWRTWGVGAERLGEAYPLAVKCPRSVFLNRASLPLASDLPQDARNTSVACGVLPPGLVHKPFAAIASIICFVVIGSFDAASTWAAASSALSFFGLAAAAGFGFCARQCWSVFGVPLAPLATWLASGR